MFSLWYTLLSWREYKERFSSKPKPENVAVEETKPIVPSNKPEPSRIPVIDSTKKSPSPVPKSVAQSTPKFKQSSIEPTPENPSTEPVDLGSKSGLGPPPKPPRAPSPHPMRSEAFDDIEFDSEESEEEDDEENSVIDSTVVYRDERSPNIKDFLNEEIKNLQKES